jgi:hypothetical protein
MKHICGLKKKSTHTQLGQKALTPGCIEEGENQAPAYLGSEGIKDWRGKKIRERGGPGRHVYMRRIHGLLAKTGMQKEYVGGVVAYLD